MTIMTEQQRDELKTFLRRHVDEGVVIGIVLVTVLAACLFYGIGTAHAEGGLVLAHVDTAGRITFNERPISGMVMLDTSPGLMRHICPVCQKAGEKSIVQIAGAESTLMNVIAFYDTNGVYHFSDPNRTTYHFRCSRGHSWSETN